MAIDSAGAKVNKVHAHTISDLRKSPIRCFRAAPASVTRRGKKVGYLLNPEDFGHMLRELAEVEKPELLKKRLGLSEGWFESLSEDGHKKE